MRAAGPDGEAAFANVVRALVSWASSDVPAVARRAAAQSFGSGTPEAKLVDALREAGLVILDEDKVRLAHESLITGWKRLADQLAEERRLFESRDRIAQLHQRYLDVPAADRDRRRERLLEGFPLAEGRELLDRWGEVGLRASAPQLPAFIRDSIARDRSRRMRRLALVGIVSAIVVGLGAWGLWARSESLEATRLAEVRLLLARSEAALRAKEWDQALASAAEAFGKDDTAETRSAAFAALTEQSPYLAGRQQSAAAGAAWLAPDTLALVSSDGKVTTLAGGETRTFSIAAPAGPEAAPFAIVGDGAGGLLALLSDGSVTHVRDGAGAATGTSEAAAPQTPRMLKLAHQADVRLADGRVLVALADGFSPAALLACDAAGPLDCREEALAGDASAVALAMDGARLALAHRTESGPRLEVWEIENGRARPGAGLDLSGFDLADEVLSLAWSADGGWLAAGTRAGRLATIRATAEGLAVSGSGKASGRPVSTLAWAPSAALLAHVCGRTAVCVSEADETGALTERRRFHGARRPVTRLAWAPEGDRLATIHDDGEARIWAMRPRNPVILAMRAPGAGALLAVAAQAASARIAAGDESGAVWVWAATDDLPQRLDPPPPASGAVSDLDVAADGALAVAHENGFVTIWPSSGAADTKVEPVAEVGRLAWADGETAVAVPLARGAIELVPREGQAYTLQPGGTERVAKADGATGIPDGTAVLTSHTDGSVRSWRPPAPGSEILVSKETVADDLSARDLDVEASGRWLAATRSDDQLKLYDLRGGAAPVSLPLFGRGTNAVAFSQDGARLAALGADDRLYVWSFDPATGKAEQRFTTEAVPGTSRAGEMDTGGRRARAIAWVGDERLAIATIAGEMLVLNVAESLWLERLRELAAMGLAPAPVDAAARPWLERFRQLAGMGPG
jgi:hypothetical protein